MQSILFDLNEAIQGRQSGGKRKNTTTGASAAAAASASATSSLSSNQSGVYGGGGSPCGSQEELSGKEGCPGTGGGHGTNPALDPGDDKSNELVLNCPCFRNELGGEGERNISPSKQVGRGYDKYTGMNIHTHRQYECMQAHTHAIYTHSQIR